MQMPSKQKSIFNFIYTNKINDMKDIYQKIKENKIECDDKYLDKCKIIKNSFLNKMNSGMEYDEYFSYKEGFKSLDIYNYDDYIDNLVTIFNKSDIEILLEVYKGLLSKKYFCLTHFNKNNEIILYPSLIIKMLNENHRNIKQFFGKNCAKLINNTSKEEKLAIYNDISNGNSIYSMILKEVFIDKFSGLEDTIFKEVYLKYLNDFDEYLLKFMRTAVNSHQDPRIDYEKFPTNNSVAFGGDVNWKLYKKRK